MIGRPLFLADNAPIVVRRVNMLPGASWSGSESRSSQRSVYLKSDMKYRFTIDMAPLKSE